MNTCLDISTYAFRGNGKYVLIIGAGISILADIVSFAGGLYSLISLILLAGYICAVFFDIINSTATGNDEAPDFPEVSNVIEDVFEPLVHMLAASLVSFGPWLAYWHFTDDAAINSSILYGLLGFGVIYFPMAMLAVVILGRLGGMSPHIVIPAIFRGGWLYWFAVLLICLLYFAELKASAIYGDQLILGTFIAAILGMFTIMTSGRILGIVYRDREEELDWL